MEFKYIVIYCTAPSKEEGESISKVLLDRKIAACVNLIEAKSLFFWQSKMEGEKEIFMVIKTKASLYKEIENTIKKIHSYDIPEIIALPIVDGSKEYLEWIENSTQGS